MIKIAIKELAYFTCQSGNLTPEFFSNRDLQIGNHAHDYLQSKYNDKSQKEVYIKNNISYMGKDLLLHGFIDGVLSEDDETIIEEIKSTTLDLDEITIDYHKEHLAQLKIYAYLYGVNNDIDKIHTRLTYISVVDYDTKSFDQIYDINELEEFLFDLLEEYLNWLHLLEKSEEAKTKTIKEIKFPYKQKRAYQNNLMKAVYETMETNDILYAIAPTGIGKTMATLFPTLKSLKTKEKIFYATAKGSGKNAPLDAIKLLSSNGLKLKTIDITAKSKICNCGKKHCRPEECAFAKGFFDKLKNATYDIFERTDIYDKETILDVANSHKICAFEFSLYLSYFCDLVIADYNYVFDPHAHLIRYFDDDTYKIKVLVDEAHNMISRSKDMYSASISTIDLRTIRARLTGLKPSVRTDCNKAIEIMEKYRERLAENALICDEIQDLDLAVAVKNIISKVEEILTENQKIDKVDDVYEIYHKLLSYSHTSDLFSHTHRYLIKLENDNIFVNLYCLDASDFILSTIQSSIKSIVFFSATMTPIKYYSDLLTKSNGKTIELPSPFNPDNLELIINSKVSTKFKNRNSSVDEIIEIIETSTSIKKGNYIVFFPSYKYLEMVLDCMDTSNYEMIIQTSDLDDKKRLEIINKFKEKRETSKLGFFVMGGAFSEGIDLIGDALSGVIIIGVGLPMICDENNILKDYFSEVYEKGYEYAYMYPGFTKVIQAVGRVIRTENDRGFAILVDERFVYSQYRKLMPNHWNNIKVINSSYVLKKELEEFLEQ
jgi:DNA excision repair protein ERCC-2